MFDFHADDGELAYHLPARTPPSLLQAARRLLAQMVAWTADLNGVAVSMTVFEDMACNKRLSNTVLGPNIPT